MDPPSPASDGAPASQSAPAANSSGGHSSGPRFSNGLHIRSRITVVCAECKRLKLKCDRRTPCGSCVKRDTVHRCQYSAAAAEKIDVQSLHNRLQIIESQMAQIIAGGLRAPPAFAGSHADNLPFPHNDRAMLATGSSGSSVTISLDDVAALWLEHIDMPQVEPAESSSSSSSSTVGTSSSQIKLEPLAADLAVLDEPSYSSLLPPLTIYYPASSSVARVTPTLVALLPSAPSLRSRIMTSIDETMRMHPCFNVKHFRARAESMFAWMKDADTRLTSVGTRTTSSNDAKTDLARSLFFPSASSSAPSSPVIPSAPPTPTLSFFASVAAAYALGVQACKENELANEAESSKGGSSAKTIRLEEGRSGHRNSTWQKTSAAGLYALSRQALAAFEMTHAYDLDYLTACILQLLFLLHDGRARVTHIAYPLVGKMVNIAQMMGLSTDPDEFPGKYSLFEAEQRRRVWWDIYYYDVFVSDCMGQAPTIQDNTYTTKMPADVDEEQFGPSSSSLPVPVPRRAGGDPTEVGFAYFTQKCRLAMLVKSVKKRTFRDPLNLDVPESSLEQAEQFEAEVKSWLSDLPKAFRLDGDYDATSTTSTAIPSVSPFLQAQRCELAIVANRLILKIFLPFLKNCTEPASDIIPRRVVSSVVDAGHSIIHTIRLLHSTWRQTRPAAFAFYSFGRTLFDASVMMACAVIVHPTGASSGVALADLEAGLDIMRDTRTAAERSKNTDGSGEVNEAVQVVEMLRAKAEGVRSGDNNVSVPIFHAGTKRKHSELADSHTLAEVFQLPYAGLGVSCSRTLPEVVTLEAGSRPSTSTGLKVRVKQRESSIVPDLSGAFDTPTTPASEKNLLKGQTPIRGRPPRRRPSTSGPPQKSQMAAPPPPSAPHPPSLLVVPSHRSTPAPDQAGYRGMPMSEPQSMEFMPSFNSPDVPVQRYTGDSELGTPRMQPQASNGYESSTQMSSHYASAEMGGMPPPQGHSLHEGVYAMSGPTSAQSTPSFTGHSPYGAIDYMSYTPSFGPASGASASASATYEAASSAGQPQSLMGHGISDSRSQTGSGSMEEGRYMLSGDDGRPPYSADARRPSLASSIGSRQHDAGGPSSWQQGPIDAQGGANGQGGSDSTWNGYKFY
ncbi:hypothetical protein BV25DRAFT_1918095 [Artomyces pyxidatus]|uniref:Uncharacterized protein n=1 Tax=Artomyces pyxidatus TaxID=48021 RepID=A0ACB8SVI0_9AGAM|nr:hypothetical protein BV25DRAFT_1918095 [Artomyces pyxidatus]